MKAVIGILALSLSLSLSAWAECTYYPDETPDRLGDVAFWTRIRTEFWKATDYYYDIKYPKPESRTQYNALLIDLAQKYFQPSLLRSAFEHCPENAAQLGDLLEEVMDQHEDLKEVFKKEIRKDGEKLKGNFFFSTRYKKHGYIDHYWFTWWRKSTLDQYRISPRSVFLPGDNEYVIEQITLRWIRAFAQTILSVPNGKVRTQIFKTLKASLKQNDGWAPVAKWSRLFERLGTLLSYEETWLYFAGDFDPAVQIDVKRFESEMRWFQKFRHLMRSRNEFEFRERILDWTYGCGLRRLEYVLYGMLMIDRGLTIRPQFPTDAPYVIPPRTPSDGYFFEALYRDLPTNHWIFTEGLDRFLMPIFEQVRTCQKSYALLELLQRYYDQLVATTNLDFQIALLREGKRAYQEEAFEMGGR